VRTLTRNWLDGGSISSGRKPASSVPLLASVLSGVSAVFEKVSVVSLSQLTVLTLRDPLMLPMLPVALHATGRTALPMPGTSP
jgi:uncharacterized membrane protein